MTDRPLRVLVWQWGRRGGAPRCTVDLAEAMSLVPGVTGLLSLSAQSELMQAPHPPDCALTYRTYTSLPGFVWRLLTIPLQRPALVARLRALRIDLAICWMPGPLDLLMAGALERLGIPFLAIIHDADAHPGDGFPLQMRLQAALARRAAGLVALSGHVARRLLARGDVGGRPFVCARHPPLDFGPMPPPPLSHGGALRLLFFGRLLPYKGLDLLAAAMRRLGARDDIVLRVVGQGPEAPELDALRALPGVTVENRWVPETEIGSLIAWSDALVLSYTEASQSGVAAASIAARRYVVATRVGGLEEQLAQESLARLCAPSAEGVADAIASLITDPPVAGMTDMENTWQNLAGALVQEARKHFFSEEKKQKTF
jgi:glycosyltransferase involved in cell wall biosynthesis